MNQSANETPAVPQPATAPVPEFLTTEELASKLRTTPATVSYWEHIGKAPRSFKIGRRRLYAVEDVEAFIATARRVNQ